MDLDYFLNRDQVVKLTADTKQGMIRELTQKLQELGLIENQARYYTQLIHRESLENTGLGSGLAVPHARTESVDRFISIFGIHEDGVDYQSHDGQPVKFVFLSIFPSSMSTTYLYFIGMLARIFSNAEKNSIISRIKTPAKMYSFLKNEAQEYFDSIDSKAGVPVHEKDSPAGVPSSDMDMIIRLDRLYMLYDQNPDDAGLKEKINGIKELIDKRSLTYYERMRNKHTNPFAVVEKGCCTGCHMEIPPVYVKQVKDQNEIPVCAHCGRFLIAV